MAALPKAFIASPAPEEPKRDPPLALGPPASGALPPGKTPSWALAPPKAKRKEITTQAELQAAFRACTMEALDALLIVLDEGGRNAVQAAAVILDRGWGPPPQRHVISLEEISTDELEAERRRLEASIAHQRALGAKEGAVDAEFSPTVDAVDPQDKPKVQQSASPAEAGVIPDKRG